jgi:hypothetical protein
MEGIDPADYIGKTIEVERFKAIGSLALEGEFLASVFPTDGKPIGGTETVVDINVDGMLDPLTSYQGVFFFLRPLISS